MYSVDFLILFILFLVYPPIHFFNHKLTIFIFYILKLLILIINIVILFKVISIVGTYFSMYPFSFCLSIIFNFFFYTFNMYESQYYSLSNIVLFQKNKQTLNSACLLKCFSFIYYYVLLQQCCILHMLDHTLFLLTSHLPQHLHHQ